MRKGGDGENGKWNGGKMEKNGENTGPLTSLPVDRLKGDRLQCQRSCQLPTISGSAFDTREGFLGTTMSEGHTDIQGDTYKVT